eukprot:scaffold1809_cov386-Prasinococcus_capsulatus_cf.AAC.63
MLNVQAPGSDECERAFMYTKMGYDSGDQHGLTIFDKVLVNGPQQSPVYTFLKSEGKLPGCAGCEVAWNYEVPTAPALETAAKRFIGALPVTLPDICVSLGCVYAPGPRRSSWWILTVR